MPDNRKKPDVPQFWMTAKKDGKCSECGARIEKDFSRIVWDTERFRAYCADCGPDIIGPDKPRRQPSR
jgi:hypothetical protein